MKLLKNQFLAFSILLTLAACSEVKKEGKTSSNGQNSSIDFEQQIQNKLLPYHYLEGHAKIKSIPEMMAEYNIPGVSIAVFENDSIKYLKTYGYSNLKESVEVTPATLFNGASLSKPVAAIAALKLVEQGLLELNEDVNEKLIGWEVPESKFTQTKKVTLKGLISHEAGIGNFMPHGYLPNEDVPTVEQMLSVEHPSVDPTVSIVSMPGESRKYSNPGYTIIQKLIQDVTKQKFEVALEELVLKPSKMNSSSFNQPIPDRLRKYAATGYSNDFTPYPYKLYPFKAAGGIWTTPTDYAKFMMTLLSDHYLGSNILLSRKMTDSVFAKTPTRLGFAKIYNEESDDVLFEHSGTNFGYTSYSVASLNNKQGVVIMTNSDNGTVLMSYIARAIALENNWDFLTPKVFESIHLTEQQIIPFIGTFTAFQSSEGFDFKNNKGVLMVSEDMSTYANLIPIAESKFIEPETNTTYEFLSGRNDKVYVRVTFANSYNSDFIKK